LFDDFKNRFIDSSFIIFYENYIQKVEILLKYLEELLVNISKTANADSTSIFKNSPDKKPQNV